ncbi:unnamed protein product [Hymenolepis diminuta]|uniref:Uncharacterized protein n=1 Tax=Hymenolepis diminuta TaxID=6216 RepID=A0A564YN15_HYMDI|nr:unnamed protein product [Hymenolepis diminuta]
MPVSYQFLRFLLISSFPTRTSLYLSLPPSRFKLVVASLNTFVLFNFGVLPQDRKLKHNNGQYLMLNYSENGKLLKHNFGKQNDEWEE